MSDDIHLRIATGAVLAGGLSAVACVPWTLSVVSGASSGGSTSVLALTVGLLLAVGSWVACGAGVAGARGRDAIGPAAFAGGLAAGIAAGGLWLPTIALWSLDDLWAASHVGETGPAVLKTVLGEAIRSLGHATIAGGWGLLGLGAAAGAVGAAARRPRQAVLDPPALVWPLLVARGAALTGIVCVIAVEPLAANGLDLRLAMLANAGLLGCVAAIPFSSAAAGHLRSPLPAHRAYVLVYAFAAALSVGIWLLAPMVAAPSTFRHPASVLYLGLPLMGAAVGATLGSRRRSNSPPLWSALPGEAAMFSVAVAAGMCGPGSITFGLAGSLFPVAWIQALQGDAAFPAVDPAVRELLTMHWKFLGIALIGAWPVPLVSGAIVTALLRCLDGRHHRLFIQRQSPVNVSKSANV